MSNAGKTNPSYAARSNQNAARVAVKQNPQQSQRPVVKQQVAKQKTAMQRQPAKQTYANRSTSAAQGRPNATMPPQDSYLARRPNTGADTTFQR